ncbi:hypothetical protein N9V86_01045 [Opitutales bacterium]|nr:hypothetical protein [Opitutales bacterium]
MDYAMHPELLERVIAGMARNAWDVATVLIAKQVIDEDMNSWEQQRLRLLELCTRPGPFFVWRTELKESLGMFDERLERIGDKDFWARIDSTDLNVGLISEALYLIVFANYFIYMLRKVVLLKHSSAFRLGACLGIAVRWDGLVGRVSSVLTPRLKNLVDYSDSRF